jgi:engulfment/cell motility protein 1
VQEEQFANEFLLRNGLAELVSVIDTVQGNTLAYALSAMQHLLELDHGWDTLAAPFIHRVALVLAAPRSLVNVCRPATAILKRLVEMDAASAPGPLVASSSRGPPPPPPGSVYRYGFDVVFEQMRRAPALLDTVVARLGSGETALVLYSMMLINSLLAHATEAWWDEFVGELDRLNVRKAVVVSMILVPYLLSLLWLYALCVAIITHDHVYFPASVP